MAGTWIAGLVLFPLFTLFYYHFSN